MNLFVQFVAVWKIVHTHCTLVKDLRILSANIDG